MVAFSQITELGEYVATATIAEALLAKDSS